MLQRYNRLRVCSVISLSVRFTSRAKRPKMLRGDENVARSTMNEKPKDYYRVFAPGVPNVRVISEPFTSEADAKRYKREMLMVYPAATCG
jgi:hypothetical protein